MMKMITRVVKRVLRKEEILVDDIHAIHFDGFLSGFQTGLEEGRRIQRENDSKVVSFDQDCHRTYLPEEVDKIVQPQVDLEEFCKEHDENPNILFIVKTKMCLVNEISQEIAKAIDFHLVDGPFDEMANDRIATISFCDIEKEYEVFVKAGYTNAAIQNLYVALKEQQMFEQRKSVRLPVPFEVEVSYNVSRFNLEGK